jgi:hypothetical protein
VGLSDRKSAAALRKKSKFLAHFRADGDISVNSTATSLKKSSNRSSFKELEAHVVQKNYPVFPKILGPIPAFGTKVHKIFPFNRKNLPARWLVVRSCRRTPVVEFLDYLQNWPIGGPSKLAFWSSNFPSFPGLRFEGSGLAEYGKVFV